MNYILLIAGIMLIILIDIRGIIRSKQRVKLSMIYLILITFWSGIALLLLMDRAPLSPAEVIKGVIEGIIGWIR